MLLYVCIFFIFDAVELLLFRVGVCLGLDD